MIAAALLAACAAPADEEAPSADVDGPARPSRFCEHVFECDSTNGGGGGPGDGPDLVPGASKNGFCARNAAGQLAVKTLNMGTKLAGPSYTRIDWISSTAPDGVLAIPELAPGEMATVYVDIPAGCFGPNGTGECSFRITVDDGRHVRERDETNNSTGVAVCSGG